MTAGGTGRYLPDETLVKAFRGGDREAFGVLYERYFDQVAGHVFLRTRSWSSQADREDLVQEIFTEALARLGTLPEDAGHGPPAEDRRTDPQIDAVESFSKWLFGVVVRYVLRVSGLKWRERQEALAGAVKQLRLTSGGGCDASAHSLLPASVQEAFRALSPRHRQVIELRYLEGHSQAQTAHIMGYYGENARNAVRNLQLAALDRLRHPARERPTRMEAIAERAARRRAATRDRIAQAAHRLFTERGYEQTTMQAVADAADVARRQLFRYFGSKQGLFNYTAGDAWSTDNPAGDPSGDAAETGACADSPHDRIAQAAHRLFTERGYEQTTMQAIADAADVPYHRVFRCFGSKQGLAEQLAEVVAR